MDQNKKPVEGQCEACSGKIIFEHGYFNFVGKLRCLGCGPDNSPISKLPDKAGQNSGGLDRKNPPNTRGE